MLTSARNNVKVKVKGIEQGAVNSVIKGVIGEQKLQAVVTKEAVSELGLKVGENCHFVFKASNVIVGNPNKGCIKTLSARNQLAGKIDEIVEGAVNCEITASIFEDIKIVAIITKASVEKLELKVGSEVVMMIKASEILAGVCATTC